VVVAVVIAIVLAHGGSSGQASDSGSPGPTGTELASLTAQVTSVPAAVLDQVGGGHATSVPSAITGDPLTSDGKPEMLYIGAEYCPYCAAERWSMIVALSRFGTFTGLATTFTSGYVAFTPVEEYTNLPDPSTGGYTTLMTPTAQQQALLEKYDTANNGAIPFIDFGNRYMSVGASYDPGVLRGLTWSQIAADLHSPSTQVAKSVLGAANYLTAVLCKLTNGKPATACTAAVQALQSRI
jgi:thiol-disulfide isomerase/thioredoxin